MAKKNIQRPHAEDAYKKELDALSKIDVKNKPANWNLSPKAVVTYIVGGKLDDGTEIETKYYGDRRLIEVAVATLLTDRALLLLGIPGTAKTWLSEHLSAAISGTSKLLIQGTAGLSEEALRYGWNYAKLLAEGPSEKSIVVSPVLKAMKSGQIVRIEELTRLPSDVQDSLITVLSEKTLPIPELNTEQQAIQGFNVIATANDRDKGVNDLSSALRRRFNTVVMPLPKSFNEEVKIVQTRVEKFVQKLDMTLSTAEAISVVNNGVILAAHFGNGTMSAADLAASLTGAIVKDPKTDEVAWKEYLETVIKDRKEWKDLYEACKSK